MSEAQKLTSRAYCLDCRRSATFYRAGVENHDRPRVEHWRCAGCGHRRMQYADVTDVEQLCRTILDAYLGGRTVQVDYPDALSLMMMEAWDLYKAWDPSRGLRFTSYATGLLRFRVNNLGRYALGRNGSKAPEGGLVSLDAPAAEGSPGLAESVASVLGDPALDRSPDLVAALSQGARGTTQPLPPRDRTPAVAGGGQ